MKPRVFEDRSALGRAAAAHAAESLRKALRERGVARLLVTADAAQEDFLAALTAEPEISWAGVEVFHCDEYVGLGREHPASFRRQLYERLIRAARPGRYHLLEAEHDPERACREEGEELRAAAIDLAAVTIGETGRVGLNVAPADFASEKPYQLVRLEEAHRREQLAAGGFATLAEVPERAISISLRQLMKADTVICVAPEGRRAEAVRRCLEGPVSPFAPGSILQGHPDATLYLDRESAALLAAKRPVEA